MIVVAIAHQKAQQAKDHGIQTKHPNQSELLKTRKHLLAIPYLSEYGKNTSDFETGGVALGGVFFTIADKAAEIQGLKIAQIKSAGDFYEIQLSSMLAFGGARFWGA